MQAGQLKPPFRKATKEDARPMAELVNMAGEGMPHYLWSGMAENGESAWDMGYQRAQRDSGGFSYTNTVLLEKDNKVVSCLIGYPLTESAGPNVYDELPSMFVPLQKLEDMACKSWYINVLATYPEHRGNGYASLLLKLAEQICRDLYFNKVSLIVSDGNQTALSFYKRHSYIEKDMRPMVKEEWSNPGKNWILLIKNV